MYIKSIRVLAILSGIAFASQAASAAVFDVSISGTMASGFDTTAVFDANLTGEAYAATFHISTTPGGTDNEFQPNEICIPGILPEPTLPRSQSADEQCLPSINLSLSTNV